MWHPGHHSTRIWRPHGAVGDTPLMVHILAVTATQKRDMQEIGLGIVFLGALAVLLSGALGLRSASRVAERSVMMVAGILLAVGFVIQLLAVHSVAK